MESGISIIQPNTPINPNSPNSPSPCSMALSSAALGSRGSAAPWALTAIMQPQLIPIYHPVVP